MRRTPLKYAATVSMSNVDKKSDEAQRPIRLCNYTDVYYNERITSAMDFMAATASDEQIRRFTLRRGDVLLTKDSETAEDIAVPSYVAEDLDDVLCGYHLAHLRPFPRVNGRFLFWALASQSIREQFSVSANGITRFGLRQDSFAEVEIPLPDRSAQQSIADFLDTETSRIDALIDKKQRMVNLLEEWFLEEVRSSVTGGLQLGDPLRALSSEVTLKDWALVKLGHDLRFGSGATPTAGIERYYDGDIPWVVTGDLRDWPLTEVSRSITPEAIREFSALKLHPAGALVVAMYGATVGRLALTTFPTTVNQACCVIHSGTDLLTEFLFYYLLAHREVLIERSVGAGQPNISQEILRAIRIPTPDVELQRRVIEYLQRRRDQIYGATNVVRSQIGLMIEHRQALITAAVTGDLQVPGVAA